MLPPRMQSVVEQSSSAPPRDTRPQRRVAGQLGLQAKLILSFSMLLLIALSTGAWLSARKSRDTLSDILGEQARQISQTLAMAAETPYETNNREELLRLGRDLLKSRNIVLVMFFDPAGKPLATACRDPDFQPRDAGGGDEFQASPQRFMIVRSRNLPSLGNFLEVSAPVFDYFHESDARRLPGESATTPTGVRMLGYLTVGISQNSEQAQLQRVSMMALGMGCGIFLLSLPLVSGLVHRILLPIRQLVAATNRLAAGNYDTRVATDRPDEIGMLARSFNEMVTSIREHKQALQVANESLAEANHDLEAKVLLRTEELESSNHRLSAEIAEKEDFLRAVSHDLNAPLRNISGMATLLLMKYKEQFDGDVVHRLERIRKNVEVETDLITELLELSRIKTRRQKMERLDVDALVTDVVAMFEDELKEKNISLIIESPLPALICEKSRLRQVFQNLVDNAIKYMGDGQVRQIQITHRLGRNEVEFMVRDTGIGIDAVDMPKVFYVFRRGRNSAEMKVPGKGVGLASVKSIIETYDGRIWVESQPGAGSTFHFTIHGRFVPALRAETQVPVEMGAGESIAGVAVV